MPLCVGQLRNIRRLLERLPTPHSTRFFFFFNIDIVNVGCIWAFYEKVTVERKHRIHTGRGHISRNHSEINVGKRYVWCLTTMNPGQPRSDLSGVASTSPPAPSEAAGSLYLATGLGKRCNRKMWICHTEAIHIDVKHKKDSRSTCPLMTRAVKYIILRP